MNLRLLTCLLAAGLLRADGLSDLKEVLLRLNGQEPVKASVDYAYWSRQGDEKAPVVTEGRASAVLEEGPQGLKLSWNRALLQAAQQEARTQAKDPEKKAVTRRAIEGLKAMDLIEYVNASEELLRTLEHGQLVDEKAEPWQGRPSRRLHLKLSPRLSKQDQKYVKEFEATATVWVGADGLPLAVETQTRMKGRALLVISFDQQRKESFQFARVGNRLVVIQHTQESSGSGGGERGQSKTTTTLRLG